jgi:hypothetical protein
VHDYQEHQDGEHEVEQLSQYLRQRKKHDRYIQRLDKARRSYNAAYRLVGDIGKKEPENKAGSNIKYIMIYVIGRYLGEDGNKDHEVEQWLEKPPKKTGNGIFVS